MKWQIQPAESKEPFNTVDLVKFICAILVVMLHVSPFGPGEKYHLLNDILQQYITRIAVPFFFAASGFFLFRKIPFGRFSFEPVKNYVKRILILYAIWTVIYLPLCIKGILEEPRGVLIGIRGFLQCILFSGSYPHLWYLGASVAAALIISFFLSRNFKPRSILIIALIMYIPALLTQTWFGLISPLSNTFPSLWHVLSAAKKVVLTTRNGLFEGFIFMAIGMLFAYKDFRIGKWKAITGFAASFILMGAEYVFVKKFDLCVEYDMYIFLVPATFFLFYLAKNITLKNSGVYTILRELSSLIFFIHMLVKEMLAGFFGLLGSGIANRGFNCLAVIVVSAALSLLIIFISRLKHFTWLSKLYR